MPSDKAFMALCDIRDNILFAQELLAGVDDQAFKSSRTLFYAATRALEIISEASRRLPDDIRARHPALPWRDIRDSGNTYRQLLRQCRRVHCMEDHARALAPAARRRSG